MKKHYLSIRSKTMLVLLLMVLLFTFTAQSQDFEVKWGMDRTLAGTSSHANFTPTDATLHGGANTYGLASIYGSGGAIGFAYVVRPWPASFSDGRFMDFTFTANQFEYHIHSFSFRLRRSDTGPREVKIRSSADGFSSDLYTLTLSSANTFYSASIPLSFINLGNSNFSFRIYGFDPANTTLGVLWFDEIKVNGVVSDIILPVSLTYFKAKKQEKMVVLSWETAWEKDSREFVVERSENLSEFIMIGKVGAAGEADGRRQYDFFDETPVTGTSYYRLKMVDKNENYGYSGVRDITIHPEKISLVVAPNPASPFYVRIARNDFDPASLYLTDMSGKAMSFQIADFEGNYISLIPESPLSSGLYVLSIIQNGKKLHTKVLVP